ncbi:MAG: twin-arginine translocase TatA/TatE family subunit [Chthoniobacterales bacterium]|nr:twin-arginine translocase TatA/TatE family subunit [Chthoniobacterales bacterium]
MIPLLAFGLPAAPEWTFIGVLALILFGPKKLPDIARAAAKILSEFQKAKEEFQRELLQVPKLPEIKQPQERRVHATSPLPPADKIGNPSFTSET